ncbi:LOW QUALITY PROTEIN: hypothetical protein PHMEG_00017388 [Phytophthora megakarya]|uniref:MULE transposase domain-containing protein n=1 Tax=Phytophthora megakarya TaxID=4795 RepID=A0A225VWM6_9STRA|nr:LOW QUALITY PROTEIN: hypothetical protein PHMEG_00017388 [Phytophthora megakarya]
MPQGPTCIPLCHERGESDTIILLQCLKSSRFRKAEQCSARCVPAQRRISCATSSSTVAVLSASKLRPKCPPGGVKCSYIWIAMLRHCLRAEITSPGSHFHAATASSLSTKHEAGSNSNGDVDPVLAASGRPSVASKVQNVVCYFRRTKLGGNDSISNVTSLVRAQACHGNEEEHEPFTFGWQWNENGQLVVGNGTDENPFLVGITTKALLRQVARDPVTFIFHMLPTKPTKSDIPFWCVELPTLLVNFTFSLCCHVTAARAALLERICISALGIQQSCHPLLVAMFMGDADSAQFNAASTVFGVDCTYTHLMCYYHLLAKVVERMKGLSKEHSDAVLRDVYDMHCTRNAQDFDAVRSAAQFRWGETPALQDFSVYFTRIWLNRRFCNWQCFHSPPGYATTNNPVEQFNRALKRDYTVHRLLKMWELLQQLRSCCRQHSIDIRQFAVTATPSEELLSRVKALQRQQLIREYTPPRMGLDFLLGTMANIVNVLYVPPLRVCNAATKRFNEHIQVSV